MKVTGLTIAAATAAVLSFAARAQDGDGSAAPAEAAAPAAPNPAADTPYAGIVARNMFGLVPIPPPDPLVFAPAPDPPPKITLTGIMTIFGHEQALFTAAPKPKPGQPAADKSYVLTEGERENDIEVVKINRETSIVTFNNHGTVQDLPLEEAKNVGGPVENAGGGPGPAGQRPGANTRAGSRPMNGPGAANPAAFSGGGGRGPQSGGGNFGGAMPTIGGGLNSAGARGSQPQASIEDQVMAAARQMALIEQTRMQTQDQVDAGKMPPLPPTLLTPEDARGNGGQSLIVPPTP